MIENLFDVSGKVVLITGGAKGIGAMMTEALVEGGAKVYISSRSVDKCTAFAAEMSKKGECVALPANLLDMEQLHGLADELAKRETRLDVLINNSGASWGSKLGEFPEKGWDKVMDLNVKSLFFLTQALVPLIAGGSSAADPGRIINISSIAAVHPASMGAYSYGPSKAAVVQLTRNLASDLARKHILVNAVAPGFFPSNMTAHMETESMAGMIPLRRVGNSRDLAGLIIFLCSEGSNFMTGTYLPIDGGMLVAS